MISAGLILALAASAFLYVQSRKFNQHLKTFARAQLSAYAGREVEIDRISSDILNRAVITGVRIMDREKGIPLLKIDRIKVSYSLLKIFRNIRDPGRLISRISFYRPRTVIDFSEGSASVRGLEKLKSSEGGVMPSWTLRIIGGRSDIIMPDGHSYFIKELRASLLLGGYPDMHLKSELEVEDLARHIKIQGDMHSLTGDFEGNISFSAFNLKGLKQIFEKISEEKFPAASIDAGLRFSGNRFAVIEDISSLNFSGTADIRKGEWKNFTVPRAQINISPSRLLVEEAVLNWEDNSVSVEGIIANYFFSPSLNLKVRGMVDA